MFQKLNVPDGKKAQKEGEFQKLEFTNFKIGTKTTGVFVGEPIDVYKHYEGKFPHSQYLGLCQGENCTFCQEGNKPKYSMRVNFLTVVNGVPTMTIAEGPASLAKALADKEEIKGEDFFTDTVVLVNRTDKTAFIIDDIKPPKELSNIKAILSEVTPFDLTGILEAQVKKQQKGRDTDTEAPF